MLLVMELYCELYYTVNINTVKHVCAICGISVYNKCADVQFVTRGLNIYSPRPNNYLDFTSAKHHS